MVRGDIVYVSVMRHLIRALTVTTALVLAASNREDAKITKSTKKKTFVF
jgi:ABC-type branched-subunit amino acid transport system ATPase component